MKHAKTIELLGATVARLSDSLAKCAKKYQKLHDEFEHHRKTSTLCFDRTIEEFKKSIQTKDETIKILKSDTEYLQEVIMQRNEKIAELEIKLKNK